MPKIFVQFDDHLRKQDACVELCGVALKAVYAAVDEQAALTALDTFAERWDKKYPKISQS